MQTEILNPKKEIIVAVKKIKGTQFVGIRNYRNQKGEKSNQTFNVGINYANVLLHDLETLRNFDVSPLANKHSIADLKKAHEQLIKSLEKRTADEQTKAELLANNDSTMNRSKAQSEAYIHIAKGLKAKYENDYFALYVYGLMLRKTIIEKGEYEQVDSKPLTLAKKAIKIAAGLKETKYKQFKVGNLAEINISGVTINF